MKPGNNEKKSHTKLIEAPPMEPRRRKVKKEKKKKTGKAKLQRALANLSSSRAYLRNIGGKGNQQLNRTERAQMNYALDRSFESSSSSSASAAENSDDDVLITNREELSRITLFRYRLEKFAKVPFFEEIVVGAFVRICRGIVNGKAKYSIYLIDGVADEERSIRQGETVTRKALKLKHGKEERVLSIDYASNKEFTDSEFTTWKEDCIKDEVNIPTIKDLNRKQRSIKDAIFYTIVVADSELNLTEFQKIPRNYARKKSQLLIIRDIAASAGDREQLAGIYQRLAELEQLAEERERMRQPNNYSVRSINYKNRMRNIEEGHKAILKEIQDRQGMEMEAPFTRRSTKPRKMIQGRRRDEIDGSDESTQCEDEGNNSSSSDESFNQEINLEGETNKVEQPSGMDLYALHDFEIDLEIKTPEPPNISF